MNFVTIKIFFLDTVAAGKRGTRAKARRTAAAAPLPFLAPPLFYYRRCLSIVVDVVYRFEKRRIDPSLLLLCVRYSTLNYIFFDI